MITLNFMKKTIYMNTYSFWKAKNDDLHRLNGKPSYQSWYENSRKKCKRYFENGRHHRLNGKPACQGWYRDGRTYNHMYYDYGKHT